MVDFLDWKYFSEEQGTLAACVVAVALIAFVILVLTLENTCEATAVKQTIDNVLLVSKAIAEREKVDIALDFYYDCYCFCGKMAFSSRKTGAFLSIMHDAFVRDSSRLFPAWTMAMSFEALQNVVFKHSVQRPPHRCGPATPTRNTPRLGMTDAALVYIVSIEIFGSDDVKNILDYLVHR